MPAYGSQPLHCIGNAPVWPDEGSPLEPPHDTMAIDRRYSIMSSWCIYIRQLLAPV